MPGRCVNTPPTNPVSATKTRDSWAENPVADRLRIQLQLLGDLRDCQDRFLQSGPIEINLDEL